MQKLLINGKTWITLCDACHYVIKDGILMNINTNRFEAVEGDEIEYTDNGQKYKGHVIGHTCYQNITTVEHGTVVLDIKDVLNNDILITKHSRIDALISYNESSQNRNIVLDHATIELNNVNTRYAENENIAQAEIELSVENLIKQCNVYKPVLNPDII